MKNKSNENTNISINGTKEEMHDDNSKADLKIRRTAAERKIIAKYINQYGPNAIFWCKNAKTAEMLIENGADVNALNHSDQNALFYYGRTHRIKKKEFPLAKVLIEHGADVNAIDRTGRTALFGCHDVKIAELLIEHGTDVNAIDHNGQNALFMYGKFTSPYCQFKSPESCIVQMLLEHGADATTIDNDGQNALFGCRQIEITKLLIEHGADPKTIDNGGRNALFECKYFSIAKLLIEHGANPNLVDHNGDKCRWADYTFA